MIKTADKRTVSAKLFAQEMFLDAVTAKVEDFISSIHYGGDIPEVDEMTLLEQSKVAANVENIVNRLRKVLGQGSLEIDVADAIEK